MRPALILIFLAACFSALHAQDAHPESRKIGTLFGSAEIPGWSLPGEADLRNFEIFLDKAVRRRGEKSVSLKSRSSDPSTRGFTLLIQQVLAANYQNRRIRYSAFVKTHAAGSANLFVRMDGEGMVVMNQDQMSKRQIVGTTDWTEHQIVLDVPAGAQQIVLGIRLKDGGQIWVDDANFEIVGLDVPVTGEKAPGQIQAGSTAFIERYKLSQPAEYEKQLQHFRRRSEVLGDSPKNMDFEN
jgi:hypothetical protein